LIKYDTLLQPLKIRKISPALVLVPSVFVMMATSPPPYYRYGSDGMVLFNDYSFKIPKSKTEALDELKNRNILFKKDTLRIIRRYNISSESLIMNGTDLKTLEVDKEMLKKELKREIGFYDYYIIDSLKIGDETLKNIRFELEEINESKVEIILKSVVLEEQNTNDKKLQRKFRIGFNRAARIMDQLADAHVVGEEEGTKARRILMSIEELNDFLAQERK